jgi:hypothetical protein
MRFLRSCLVEVRHIGIEDALELLLMQDEEGKERAEEEVCDRRVARPPVLGMYAQKGLPGLSCWPGGAHGSYFDTLVFLIDDVISVVWTPLLKRVIEPGVAGQLRAVVVQMSRIW